MNINDKLIEDLANSIHQKYNCLTSREHIKSAINIHLCDFYKSVTKSAVLMESAYSLSETSNNKSELSGDDSSEDMWKTITTSQFTR